MSTENKGGGRMPPHPMIQDKCSCGAQTTIQADPDTVAERHEAWLAAHAACRQRQPVAIPPHTPSPYDTWPILPWQNPVISYDNHTVSRPHEVMA